jgi:glutamyl-tRNA synthetase
VIVPVGRFAPSPTGPLHLGNLRTALLAWLFARSAGGRFVVRMEDLDRVTSSPAHEKAQLADLAALGLDWDGEVIRQSERFDVYRRAIGVLTDAGLTYPCYCTRREIREAASAPHEDAADAPLAGGAYPGTCRELDASQRAQREAAGRTPALRLRADGARVTFNDRLHGETTGVVDDVVLSRNDGVPAYNLAVVVDDDAQGVTEVVRGDDLLTSTPRQIHLARLLGLSIPGYAHVPLVLGADGQRLAKRHGAITLADLAANGVEPAAVRTQLAASVGLCTLDEQPTLDELLERFDPERLPTTPWTLAG